MAGEAKRDYPASISYQSPWYKEYPLVENYFARVNTALTRGVPHVKLAVIHPVESYWLFWGPKEQTAPIREEMDENFIHMIEWLLYGTVDFDFISESLLPDLNMGQEEEKLLKVGAMKYDTVLVPNCLTLRNSTLEILEKFKERGGRVIFAGQLPKYADAYPSDRGAKLAEKCETVAFSKYRLLEAVKGARDIEVLEDDGKPSTNLIYQMREEGENRWLFLCHVNRTEKISDACIVINELQERKKNQDLPREEKLRIRIRGAWKVTVYDAMSGEIYPVNAEYHKGDTVLKRSMFDHDSLLLWLEPAGAGEENNEFGSACAPKKCSCALDISDQVEIVRSESNVSILDLAEYAFDGGEWQDEDEILRIDNRFRENLGYPLRMEAFAQPWTNDKVEGFEHTLALRFHINTETALKGTFLAMENDEKTKIFLDEKPVENKADGWYVDHCIRKILMPDMEAGEHELIVEIPYNSKVNIEAMFLLGEFSVKVVGRDQILGAASHKAAFSDLTSQGYPFYGGNVTYQIPFVSNGGEVSVRENKLSATVIKATVDGKEAGYIAFSPYEISLGKLPAGEHMLELTVFGNRVNTFGTLHNCDRKEDWYGPNAWRTTGDLWAYEYQIRQTGLLKAPVLMER